MVVPADFTPDARPAVGRNSVRSSCGIGAGRCARCYARCALQANFTITSTVPLRFGLQRRRGGIARHMAGSKPRQFSKACGNLSPVGREPSIRRAIRQAERLSCEGRVIRLFHGTHQRQTRRRECGLPHISTSRTGDQFPGPLTPGQHVRSACLRKPVDIKSKRETGRRNRLIQVVKACCSVIPWSAIRTTGQMPRPMQISFRLF